MKTPYQELGVPPDADGVAIKRAYRARAHKAHPDRPGGSNEEFHAVTRAYEILSDPARRRRFDSGSDGAPLDDPRRVMLESVAAAMLKIIDTTDFEHLDMIGALSVYFQEARKKLRAEAKDKREMIRGRESAARRIKKRDGGHNMLVELLRGDIRQRQMELEELERNIEISGDILKLISEYRYEGDITPASHMDFAAMMLGMRSLR